jgi:hypothetical protein
MARVAERVVGHAVYQLRIPYSREIGRIIVQFAYFEQCVQEMAWNTMGISDAAGRIAVREPRVIDRLSMVRDLIGLRGGFWDEPLYKSIYSRANLIAAKRHLLAHGIWFYDRLRDEWHVQLTRGSWPKSEAELVAGSKKITPESVLITLDDLRLLTSQISELISDLKALRQSSFDATPSSPEIAP